jgi:hypothetical protein
MDGCCQADERVHNGSPVTGFACLTVCSKSSRHAWLKGALTRSWHAFSLQGEGQQQEECPQARLFR